MNRSEAHKLRVAAMRAGEHRYCTGVPCSRGHLADRYVGNNACVECNGIHDREGPAAQRKRARQLKRATERAEKLETKEQAFRVLRDWRKQRAAERDAAAAPRRAAKAARLAAASAGEKTFEGHPCSKGHTKRSVKDGKCEACAKIKKAIYRRSYRKRPSQVVRRAEELATRERGAVQRIVATHPKPDGCEICGRPGGNGRPGSPKPLHFDHDHTTHEFRGWLCGPCNQTLGLVRDDPEILQRMIEYLATFRAAEPWR